ncbi:bifunctional phosphoribosyl-AMP cyclohydrolase/phosphoribosyl-ATP diphosphatase HisIE [Ferrimonas aestuarii]|uniref:Histidine biosynthesis bifunctional protein HisIE n=1 Tax=Ferrimonas aestuarii TaxID=2569539 RepID=A0A4V5NVV6_9GAMM|nr:bifunctional phosphoribosyl-AMP cyclohydrolase/phosphoribosyl-ATP diphosphatase HisIE [Ferrimonas aestuarii]TKB52798.1 bifunctional phosphoribosyl-AMP cyclohydrolase/phosphoribosyl-ATP diphosphatase HisIE [Ferrimonas aestuarii]
MTTLSIDWAKMDNLVPVVVQDYRSGQVLMLGYMNPEAMAVTIETKKVTFYSRSKQRLWTKGESSGNVLTLVEIGTDCDNDAILIQAVPEGPTCHLGNTSCFLENQPFLGQLASLVHARRDSEPQSSYTASLLQGNPRRVAQKVGEEGVEVALAAATNDKQNLIDETADLLYHLTVLLEQQQLPMTQVIDKLIERHK